MLAKRGQTIDKVLDFQVPDSVLVDRVVGRLVHPASGRSYHEKFAPPKVGAPISQALHVTPLLIESLLGLERGSLS